MPASVIVLEVMVRRILANKAKRDAPVSRHSNRPFPFPVALQRAPVFLALSPIHFPGRAMAGALHDSHSQSGVQAIRHVAAPLLHRLTWIAKRLVVR